MSHSHHPIFGQPTAEDIVSDKPIESVAPDTEGREEHTTMKDHCLDCGSENVQVFSHPEEAGGEDAEERGTMRQVREKLAEIRDGMNVGKPMSDEAGGGRAGHIYVRDDPQERCGPGTKLVVVQGDGEGPYTDTYYLGIFWDEALAEALADRLRGALEAGGEDELRDTYTDAGLAEACDAAASAPGGRSGTMADTCIACGSYVRVVSSDEGTSYYQPVDADFEHVGYRYRPPESQSGWSHAPASDAEDMETLAEKGWQVERLYRRCEDE